MAQKISEPKKSSLPDPKLIPEPNESVSIPNTDNEIPKPPKSKIPKKNAGIEPRSKIPSNQPKPNLEPQSKEINGERKKSNLNPPNHSQISPKPYKNIKSAPNQFDTENFKPPKTTKQLNSQPETENRKPLKNSIPNQLQIKPKETSKKNSISSQNQNKPKSNKKDITPSKPQNEISKPKETQTSFEDNSTPNVINDDTESVSNEIVFDSSSNDSNIDINFLPVSSFNQIIDNIESKQSIDYFTKENSNDISNDLDDLLNEVQDWNSDFLSLNFTKYHELTEKLMKGIKTAQFNSEIDNFKAAAILAKITPTSDKEILMTSLSILHKMANQSNSSLFVDCNIIESLVKIAFSNKEINPMSKMAANILKIISNDNKVKYGLLQYDCLSMIAKCISTQTSRERFNAEYSPFILDCIEILIILCQKTSAFSKYSKYLIPLTLLNLLKIFKADEMIQNKISNLFRVLLDFDENIEILECEDLSPLFSLLDSNNKETVENTIFAISNGVQISDSFVDTIAELEEPLGIVQLCNQLKKGSSELNTEILKSLVKLTSFKQGLMEALPKFNQIAMFLDIDLNECMSSPTGQSDIMYAIRILKNFSYIVPDRVANAVDGKLRFVCSIGGMQIVLELAKIISKTETGKKVLGEVRDMPQIASML